MRQKIEDRLFLRQVCNMSALTASVPSNPNRPDLTKLLTCVWHQPQPRRATRLPLHLLQRQPFFAGLFQWIGVCLIPLIKGGGNYAIDWGKLAIARPEVISVPRSGRVHRDRLPIHVPVLLSFLRRSHFALYGGP